MNFVRMLTFALAFAMAAAMGTTAARATPPPAVSNAGLVDINHATVEELRTLPDVGDAYARAIVKHRPYKNKTQLRSKGVIPLAAYKKIKDRIVARQ
jgi:DNA uptake protein ComE-like DNA-binding protein